MAAKSVGDRVFGKIFEEMEKASKNKQRTDVLNWDTSFDTIIKDLLLLHFSRTDKVVKKLFEPSIHGPLVSLTHKARLMYALGLIDKTTLDDLQNIHNIRNKFAHSIEPDFSSDEVLKLVQKLSTAKIKKKRATAKNSFRLYASVLHTCVESLKDALEQEKYRKAVLLSAKKEKESEKKIKRPKGMNR
ncbi:MAG: hypothetical protein ISS70_08675 [Phycisphaerae bacterium]|nr:hypothetical protein [Phycisphaerae bacterium]